MQSALVLLSLAVVGASASASSIGLPEQDQDVAPVASLIQGSSLLENEAVQRTNSLRDRIMERLQRQKLSGASKEKTVQAISMEASANLLNDKHEYMLMQSLIQRDQADATLENAVKTAIGTKNTKRVTLEEVLVVDDVAKNTMESVTGELSGAFSKMMSKHQQCQKCQTDCPTMQWREYSVHTMAECKQHCKLIICKEGTQQEVAEFEQRSKEPKYAEPTVYSSYLENYNKAHGQDGITVADEDKFEIVWEQPSEQTSLEPSTLDPLEQLRSADALALRQKSAEQVLRTIHEQEEMRKQEEATEKLVNALA